MIQATFLPPVYLLDSSSPIHLEDLNRILPGQPPATPAFTAREREPIWEGLERLANDGRLVLIKQVVEELSDPAFIPVLDRLRSFRGYRVLKHTNDLRRRYRDLMRRHPDLARAIARYDPTRDPADPWLVVNAHKHGLTIVTEELRRTVRAGRPRRGPPIPDICDKEGIRCISLRHLANDEGWLSNARPSGTTPQRC